MHGSSKLSNSMDICMKVQKSVLFASQIVQNPHLNKNLKHRCNAMVVWTVQIIKCLRDGASEAKYLLLA